LGWFAADWRGRNIDAEIRTHLLDQATAIVQAINPEDAKALSFTAADSSMPTFQRIRKQMTAYGWVIRHP
jgi:hypothetical protein